MNQQELNARALEAIRQSSLEDFTSSLAWAQWSRDVAKATADHDEYALLSLIQTTK